MARGGFRPGAGRPRGSRAAGGAASAHPTGPRTGAAGPADPLAYLLAVMNDPEADPARRDRAAIAALPYLHARPGAEGKKGAAARGALDAEDGTEWEGLLS